jgi:tetratricopeptide (TPR) repeat protein
MTPAFALLAAIVSAASPAPPAASSGGNDVAVGDTTPFFTRAEPNLAAGRRALDNNDVDVALERFRRAVTATDDERSVVEYDVAQALTMRAMAAAKEAQASSPPPAGAPPAATPEGTPPAPPDVDDALAAFERAATLARDQRLTSEARLGAGNAALVGGKLDDAIGLLRKALVADPGNDRARRNLQRALTMKQQQPPPPPKDGDKQDGDTQDGDKQDGDKQDGDKQDGDKQDGDKQDGDKQDGDKQDGDKQDGDKQDGDDQPKPADQQKPGDEKKPGDEDKPEGESPGKAEPVKPKPTTKQEAERQLKGIRSRERPLSPFEMRGTDKQTPSTGKDW